MDATERLHSRMYPSACSPGELPSGELTTKHLRLHTGAPSVFRGESEYKVSAVTLIQGGVGTTGLSQLFP